MFLCLVSLNFSYSQELKSEVWGSVVKPKLQLQKKAVISSGTIKDVVKPTIVEYSTFSKSTRVLKIDDAKFVKKLKVSDRGKTSPQTKVMPSFNFKDQASENIHYLDKAHGLFSNTIISVVEDKLGYIWVASENDGIIRIDGTRVKQYTVQSNLLSNSASDLCADSQDRLWIGTEKGLCYLKENKIFKIEHEGFNNVIIRRIKEDHLGNIWVAASGKGLFKISGNTIEVFNEERGIASNNIEDFDIEKSGRINIATFAGWTIIDNNNITIIKDKNQIDPLFTPVCVKRIQDKIWFGCFTGNNFYWKDGRLFKVKLAYKYERVFQIEETKQGIWFSEYGSGMILLKKDGTLKFYDSKAGLVDRNAFKFLVDHSENIWVADPFAGLSFIKISPFSLKDDLGRSITKFSPSRNGGFWISHNGGGLCYLKDRTLVQHNAKMLPGNLTIDHLWDFIENEDGSLWTSTHGLGIGYLNATNFDLNRFEKGNVILGMTKDWNGNVWFATSDNGLVRYDEKKARYISYTTKHGVSSNSIRALFLDHSGKIWVSSDNGIDIIDKGKFSKYSKVNLLPSKDINSIFEDDKNRIWIATNDAGIAIVSGDNIQKITAISGLISDRVLKVFDDKKNGYWVITTSGLSLLKEKKTGGFLIENYGYRYGSFMQDFTGATIVLEDGRIWFGNTKGYVEFNPSMIPKKVKANLVIENMWINRERVVNFSKSISTTNNATISLNVSLLNWSFLGGDSLFYSLVKPGSSDTLWQQISANKNFNLEDLGTGTFYLNFKFVGNRQVQFFKGPVLHLSNPWYASIWFSLIIIIATIILLRVIIIYRTNLIREKRDELENIVKNRTAELLVEKKRLKDANFEIEKKVKERDVLIYEMHHRVKNNLQTISSLIDMQLRSLKGKSEIAVLKDAVRRISAMSTSHELLYSNDNIGEICLKTFITELIKVQEAFLELPNKKVSIEIDVPSVHLSFSSCIDLGMIVSEAVANSMEHAFEGVEAPVIKISAVVKEGQCTFVVSDNGVGFRSDQSINEKDSLGLRLIKIFASKLEGTIVIEDSSQGTMVRVDFPYVSKVE